MPICNVLIKTLGFRKEKFILQLDSTSIRAVTSFQILPSNQFGFDFVGKAQADLGLPLNDPDNSISCLGYNRNTDSQDLTIELYIDGDPVDGFIIVNNNMSLVVGMQSVGEVWDNTRNSHDALLWKVVSISGQPPPSWRSMDIFQDLPAPSGDSAVV
jgi:hypothetical protein